MSKAKKINVPKAETSQYFLGSVGRQIIIIFFFLNILYMKIFKNILKIENFSDVPKKSK